MRAWLAVGGSVGAACALAGAARADTWSGGLEVGAEVDSNVRRVEVGPGISEAPTAAPLGRAGGRVLGAGATRLGAWSLRGLGQVRTVVDPTVVGDDVAVAAADGRWEVHVPGQPARLAVRADDYDTIALRAGARAFASRGAEAILTVDSGTDRRFAISAGGRDFRYDLDRDFDWRGAVLGVQAAATVWRAAPAGDGDAVASIDVVADYRLERRRYGGLAFTDGCVGGAMVAPACFVPTTERRRDLHHQLVATATYTGDQVVSVTYDLTIADSTSFGQSVVRHRLGASATTSLPAKLLATVALVVDVDRYPVPLVIARDVQSQTFTSLDDENRNSASVLVTRRLGARWAVEARYAYWSDAFASGDYHFRRQVGYLGLVWGRIR